MRPTYPSIVFSAVLIAIGSLWGGASTARAQTAASTYRGAIPGYYYSPGGYSGGYYFYPGYYPVQRATSAAATVPARTYYGYNTGQTYAAPAPRTYTNTTDWTTGRTNFPIPLTKPWLRPLR
jgi:hypothetical protein